MKVRGFSIPCHGVLMLAIMIATCFIQGGHAQTTLLVYDGSTGTLGSGWLDYSWADHSLQSTDTVNSGDSYSASMVCNSWQGLYLSHASLDISSYSTFSFWINGGSSPSDFYLTVQLVSSVNSQSLTVSDYVPSGLSSSWVQVEIPISSFGLAASNNNAITGFWFQGDGKSGTPTVYFDDIAFVSQEVAPTSGPSLTVDASSKTAISPLIYGATIFWSGMSASDQTLYEAFVKDVRLPMNRIGGDATTRYNWQVDSSNSGEDWYYVSGSGTDSPVAGAMYDYTIGINEPLGVATAVTIPMIQYINRDSQWGCSYRQSIYGAQQSYDPYLHPYNGDNCGNGIDTSGNDILDTDPLATDILNTPDIQKEWVQHIVSTWGNSASSGIVYQLDNEVSNWAFMHRDVHPQAVTYSEIVNQTIIYASAVKAADPTATVAAPSEIQFAWYPDWGGQTNIEYFLNNIKAYEQANNQIIVDTFDVHYPDANDNHWPVLNDVDRLRQIVDATYPGKGISISEWTMSGTGPLNGALATADQIGKYAKNSVKWASIWGLSDTDITGPISYGLRIFRNYDGSGSGFGDQYLSSSTADESTLAVHAAIRLSDNALTILVINKNAAAQTSTLTLSNFQIGSDTAQVYEYSNSNTGAIISKPALSVSASGFSTTFTPNSLTMIIIQGAQSADTVCAGPIGENQELSLSCPSPSQVISSVQFASYGTPNGSCGSFADSPCNAATSQSVFDSYCLNQNTCSFQVGNGAFTDPCVGTLKHFYAQVTCS